jgi:hypothetical protein
MRTLSFLWLAAALVAPPVLAQTSSPTAVHATAEQLQDIEGTYKLSNGRIITLLTLDDRLYVELNRSRKELVAVAENAYASRDGRIRVTYNPDASPVLTVEADRELLERALTEPRYRMLRGLR